MMFVEEQGHSPMKSNEEDHEIRNIVRSLAHHPSILLWAGCNEVIIKYMIMSHSYIIQEIIYLFC